MEMKASQGCKLNLQSLELPDREKMFRERISKDGRENRKRTGGERERSVYLTKPRKSVLHSSLYLV